MSRTTNRQRAILKPILRSGPSAAARSRSAASSQDKDAGGDRAACSRGSAQLWIVCASAAASAAAAPRNSRRAWRRDPRWPHQAASVADGLRAGAHARAARRSGAGVRQLQHRDRGARMASVYTTRTLRPTLEQQAKQRLTGGVILVVLLVLLVPELLTGPRPRRRRHPAPPDQAPMRSYTMDLARLGRANGAPVAPRPPCRRPAPNPPATRRRPARRHRPPRSRPPPAPPSPRRPPRRPRRPPRRTPRTAARAAAPPRRARRRTATARLDGAARHLQQSRQCRTPGRQP